MSPKGDVCHLPLPFNIRISTINNKIMDTKELQKLIAIWFEEDIRDGDHTSLSCIPETEMGCQQLIVKEEGIIAGIEVAKEIIAYFDPECRMEQLIEDGTHVKPGDIAFRVYGKELSLLQIERTMLNVMQRMSGVATTAHKYQSPACFR